jgi:hypothetical protein
MVTKKTSSPGDTTSGAPGVISTPYGDTGGITGFLAGATSADKNPAVSGSPYAYAAFQAAIANALAPYVTQASQLSNAISPTTTIKGKPAIPAQGVAGYGGALPGQPGWGLTSQKATPTRTVANKDAWNQQNAYFNSLINSPQQIGELNAGDAALGQAIAQLPAALAAANKDTIPTDILGAISSAIQSRIDYYGTNAPSYPAIANTPVAAQAAAALAQVAAGGNIPYGPQYNPNPQTGQVTPVTKALTPAQVAATNPNNPSNYSAASTNLPVVGSIVNPLLNLYTSPALQTPQANPPASLARTWWK